MKGQKQGADNLAKGDDMANVGKDVKKQVQACPGIH